MAISKTNIEKRIADFLVERDGYKFLRKECVGEAENEPVIHIVLILDDGIELSSNISGWFLNRSQYFFKCIIHRPLTFLEKMSLR